MLQFLLDSYLFLYVTDEVFEYCAPNPVFIATFYYNFS